MQNKYEALAELLKDEETAKSVLGSSPEEAQANLKAKGLDFSLEELKKMAESALASTDGKGELNEDTLDNVSGGVFRPAIMSALSPAILRVMVGSAIIWRRKW